MNVVPIFAEIRDKMPPLNDVWMIWIAIGVIIAFVTTGLSMIRLWAGGVMVALSFAMGLLAAWPDPMDEGIVQELGAGYLFQQRILSFVPFTLAVTVWFIARLIRRHRQAFAVSADETTSSGGEQVR